MLQSIQAKELDNAVYNYDPRIIMFEKNADQIDLVFKTEPGFYHHKYATSLKIESGIRPTPALLWKFHTDYRNESLKLHAFKEFKLKDTKLFKAPFLNTSGNVCLGSSEFDVETFYRGNASEITDSVIKSFFNSAFTHTGDKDAIHGNILTLSRELLTMTEFPLDVLKPIKSLEDESDDED